MVKLSKSCSRRKTSPLTRPSPNAVRTKLLSAREQNLLKAVLSLPYGLCASPHRTSLAHTKAQDAQGVVPRFTPEDAGSARPSSSSATSVIGLATLPKSADHASPINFEHENQPLTPSLLHPQSTRHRQGSSLRQPSGQRSQPLTELQPCKCSRTRERTCPLPDQASFKASVITQTICCRHRLRLAQSTAKR